MKGWQRLAFQHYFPDSLCTSLGQDCRAPCNKSLLSAYRQAQSYSQDSRSRA